MGGGEQVFPGDGVFISDPNILIPFTSDYIGDIDWLKGFHAVQVKIIVYLQHISYDFDYSFSFNSGLEINVQSHQENVLH